MKDADPPAAALDPELRALMQLELEPSSPADDALLARVKARVLRAITPAFATVQPATGQWETIAPGVERKMLWVSGDAQSCMVRLAPGAVVAGHAHAIDEECVVLSGTLRIGDSLLLHEGDFHVAAQGSTHAKASTETGALVYLRGAREPSAA
jgi:quercetin dioxygenase-like cupin family protein